jgi:hypothetical protein
MHYMRASLQDAQKTVRNWRCAWLVGERILGFDFDAAKRSEEFYPSTLSPEKNRNEPVTSPFLPAPQHFPK